MFNYIQTPCSLKQVINLLNIIIITTEVFNYLEPTLPEHPSSPPGFNGVRFARSLVFWVLICRSLFVLFLLVIVLSVLRFTDSDQLPLWYLQNLLKLCCTKKRTIALLIPKIFVPFNHLKFTIRTILITTIS